MKELWQIMMNLKDWVKGSPIRMLVVAILMRKFWLSRRKKENVDFKYLKRLFGDFPGPKGKDMDVLTYCYYVVYDEDLLKDPFFERFSVIQYVFADGSHLQAHDPAKLFGMKWISECTVEDNLQRMFVAQGFSQDTMTERVMLCTYPLGIVSRAVFCSNKLLLNWFLRDAVLVF